MQIQSTLYPQAAISVTYPYIFSIMQLHSNMYGPTMVLPMSLWALIKQ